MKVSVFVWPMPVLQMYIRQLKNVSSFLFVASEAASKTLVVNNLSFNATEEVLQSTFEKAVSIRIPQRDGRPKG